MSGPANGEGPPRLHKRSRRAEAGETSWLVRAGVQTTRRFKAVGEDCLAKGEARQGINANRKPTPLFLGAGKALSEASRPRSGWRKDRQESREMPKLPNRRSARRFRWRNAGAGAATMNSAVDYALCSLDAGVLARHASVGHSAACLRSAAPHLRRPATAERIRLCGSCGRLRAGFSGSSTIGSTSCWRRLLAMRSATWQP